MNYLYTRVYIYCFLNLSTSCYIFWKEAQFIWVVEITNPLSQ